MEYMYINLRFKAKSAHVKSKTASLLKLYLTKSRDRQSHFPSTIVEDDGGGGGDLQKEVLINKM